MSRVNHACGRCEHRAELHAGHDAKNGGATRCLCCQAGSFDGSGPITVEPTYTLDGVPEDEHYGPGTTTRWIGGGPSRTHTCSSCVAFDNGRTS